MRILKATVTLLIGGLQLEHLWLGRPRASERLYLSLRLMVTVDPVYNIQVRNHGWYMLERKKVPIFLV